MHRSEIPIDEPCPMARDWSSLTGDEQKRFCGQCSRHVHDLSELTEDEARALVTTQHVCVRYTYDAAGRLLHRGQRLQRAALVLGAALAAASAEASTVPVPQPQAPPTSEPGWLPWLAEMASSWWSPEPEAPPIAPVVPPPVARRTVPPYQPHQVLGGVPRLIEPAATGPVRVDDRTGRPHEWVESSCCGRSAFQAGQAWISVGHEGYVELVGEPGTRVKVSGGDVVLCTDTDGQASCRVR